MSAAVATEAPTQTWRAITSEMPPQDRTIRIVANVACRDEWSAWVELYEGLARWNEASRDWLDERGMSIRMYYESELIILEWTEENQERRFVLVRSGTVMRLAPCRPALAALPAPAWHTTDPYSSAFEGARKWLDQLSSAEVFELLEIHNKFIRSLVKLSEWGDWGEVTRRCVELPVLKGGAPDRHLGYTEKNAMWEMAKKVEERLEGMLLNRYREELRKRSAAGKKAANTKRQRTLHDRLSGEVSRPFRRAA